MSSVVGSHLSWDEYFMELAKLSAKRSKDPSTQVGAVVVDSNHKIVGTGYNGLPKGFIDEEFHWDSRDTSSGNPTKYPYVVHAELNAILNSTRSTEGCTIYVTLFPCHDCAKAISQSGISTVIYLDDKYSHTLSDEVSREILDKAGITYYKYSVK